MKERIRLALIGCGAVARIHHLPAIARVAAADLAVLVDPSLERARELAAKYRPRRVVRDYREVTDEVDAAIVATPNYLHAPIAIDLLRRGIHVLVEKPMALSSQDCEQMISAAQENGAVLAVGMEMRFFHPCRFVRQALSKNLLGRIDSFDLRVGVVSNWPSTTDYFLHKKQSGGGVLIHYGVHVLDLLLWWLGDYAEVSYRDDALGGVEANCEMKLRLRAGARGTAEISRMRKLRNTCLIEGERGSLEIELWDPDGHVYLKHGDDLVLNGCVGAGADAARESAPDVFLRQLVDFVEAIRQRRAPFIPGLEVLPAVRLIETCYASKQALELPWMTSWADQNGYQRVA